MYFYRAFLLKLGKLQARILLLFNSAKYLPKPCGACLKYGYVFYE